MLNPDQRKIPEGWVSANIRDIGDVVSGDGFPEKYQGQKGLEFPFFKVGNLKDVEPGQLLTVSPNTVDNLTIHQIRGKIIPQKSIIFAKIGMAIRLNRRRIVGVPCCIDNNLMAIIPSPAIIPEFLVRLLELYNFEDISQATTVPSIRKSDIENVSLFVPPLAEQRRIVVQLEALLADCERVRGRLDAVEEAMQRFRQAVLGAACSGRLTEGWREEHIVLQETSWELSKLQDMGNWSTGGTPPRQIKSFFAGNIPWVKSGDLNDGVIADTEERISKEGLDNSNAKILPVGTISMALYGATIGKVGILGIEAATNQACANCIVNKEKIINKYLFYFLIEQRQSFIDAGQGGAQPNLTNKIGRLFN